MNIYMYIIISCIQLYSIGYKAKKYEIYTLYNQDEDIINTAIHADKLYIITTGMIIHIVNSIGMTGCNLKAFFIYSKQETQIYHC